MALRLARLFGNTPEFWLNAQRSVDLWDAEKSLKKSVHQITPLTATQQYIEGHFLITRREPWTGDEDLASRRRRQRKRHPIPEHLETETVTIEPELKICPCCGKPLQKIGEEVSEEILDCRSSLRLAESTQRKFAAPI